MQKPDLYRNNSRINKIESKPFLEEFTTNKRWRENATILDIGCGDGSTNKEVLQKFVPTSCKKIVGSDISEKMIEYARKHYENDLVEFLLWDASEELPVQLRGIFDHVFSFYALHWINKQEAAFLNIYNSLTAGGNCLLVFLGYSSIAERFRALSRTQKWAEHLKDVDMIVSPYHDSKDPKGEVTHVMKKVGFKHTQVNFYERSFMFHENVEEYKNLVKSLNPFDGLNDNWDEFMTGHLEVAPDALTHKYTLIVDYSSK